MHLRLLRRWRVLQQRMRFRVRRLFGGRRRGDQRHLRSGRRGPGLLGPPRALATRWRPARAPRPTARLTPWRRPAPRAAPPPGPATPRRAATARRPLARPMSSSPGRCVPGRGRALRCRGDLQRDLPVVRSRPVRGFWDFVPASHGSLRPGRGLLGLGRRAAPPTRPSPTVRPARAGRALPASASLQMPAAPMREMPTPVRPTPAPTLTREPLATPASRPSRTPVPEAPLASSPAAGAGRETGRACCCCSSCCRHWRAAEAGRGRVGSKPEASRRDGQPQRGDAGRELPHPQRAAAPPVSGGARGGAGAARAAGLPRG